MEKTSEQKVYSILNILLIELRARGAEQNDMKVYHLADVCHRLPTALLNAATNQEAPDFDDILETIYARADAVNIRATFEHWSEF